MPDGFVKHICSYSDNTTHPARKKLLIPQRNLIFYNENTLFINSGFFGKIETPEWIIFGCVGLCVWKLQQKKSPSLDFFLKKIKF